MGQVLVAKGLETTASLRAGGVLRGGEAVAEIGSATAPTARSKELTRWLEQDVTELTPLFREVIPQLRAVLEA